MFDINSKESSPSNNNRRENPLVALLSRRIGLVSEGEGDAEFTRMLKEKRATDRKVSRLKEAQDALFTQLNETTQKEETSARKDLIQSENEEFERNILEAARNNRREIHHRLVQVRLAALELLESDERDDKISQKEIEEREEITNQFLTELSQAEEAERKPVYVQYSWDPRQIYNNARQQFNNLQQNNNNHNGYDQQQQHQQMMRIPTPPATSGGYRSGRASRPTSAMSRTSQQHQQQHYSQQQQQQQQQHIAEMFEATPCA